VSTFGFTEEVWWTGLLNTNRDAQIGRLYIILIKILKSFNYPKPSAGMVSFQNYDKKVLAFQYYNLQVSQFF
jgi:hypothetical protein